jgi:hypothetical protein
VLARKADLAICDTAGIGPRATPDVTYDRRWGGWGSNPRPADYEKYGPALRVRYLHGYHGAVPPMALIALFARVTRSTNRSTLYHGEVTPRRSRRRSSNDGLPQNQ